MRPKTTLVALLTMVVITTMACAGDPSEPAALTLADDDVAADDDASTETSGAVLDLAADPSPALACDKVDLLFVIDDSHSMLSEQGNLIASFPEFFTGIQDTLDTVASYHVGVIATDAYAFNGDGCRELGALVTQTGGEGSSNAGCGPFTGGRFMTEADALEVFACAGQLGIDGATDERPMQAMQAALTSPLADADGCNHGFSRDDALLVVVIITDEEDDHQEVSGALYGSPGEPGDWFAAIAEHKGVESNAVILSIVGGLPRNQCGEPKGVGAEDSPRLRAFTELFTHGYLGDICAWSYGDFFTEAISVVESGCAGFEPVP